MVGVLAGALDGALAVHWGTLLEIWRALLMALLAVRLVPWLMSW